MNVLLIHPQISRSRLAFRYALALVRDRSITPPLDLLAAAARLPRTWGKRLVDLNITRFSTADLRWADCAILHADRVQRFSAWRAVGRCRRAGVRILAYGDVFHPRHSRWRLIDHGGASLCAAELEARCTEASVGSFCRERAGDPERVDPAWELADLASYRVVSLPVEDDASLAPETGSPSGPDTWWLRQLSRLRAVGWRGRVCLRRMTGLHRGKAWNPTVLRALAAWRRNRQGVSFSSELTLEDVGDSVRLRRLTQAGIVGGFLHVDLWCAREGGDGLTDETWLTEALKRAQRLKLQIRGGFVSRHATDIAASLKRAVRRLHYRRIEQALTALLHAPVVGRHVMAALGSLIGVGLSPRGALRVCRRAASVLVRRPRLFPLALTRAIYGEHYAAARRIGAVT